MKFNLNVYKFVQYSTLEMQRKHKQELFLYTTFVNKDQDVFCNISLCTWKCKPTAELVKILKRNMTVFVCHSLY